MSGEDALRGTQPSAAEAIAREVEALSPPAKLRLAADLMEAQRGELAHTIASAVVAELGAAIALRKLERLEWKGRTPDGSR